MSVADATASGVPYPVLSVSGAAPTQLDQFVGETEFVLSKAGVESTVCGVGAESPGGVRFHEKSAEYGKDVRVWNVAAGPDGAFTAASA